MFIHGLMRTADITCSSSKTRFSRCYFSPFITPGKFFVVRLTDQVPVLWSFARTWETAALATNLHSRQLTIDRLLAVVWVWVPIVHASTILAVQTLIWVRFLVNHNMTHVILNRHQGVEGLSGHVHVHLLGTTWRKEFAFVIFANRKMGSALGGHD